MKYSRSAVLCCLAVALVLAVQVWLQQPHFARCPGWFASCSERTSLFGYKITLFHKGSREQQAKQERPRHPLDPLTFSEIHDAHTLLLNSSLASGNPIRKYPRKSGNHPKPNILLHAVVLEEPDKEDVLAWKEGDPLPHRKASVILMVEDAIYKMVVDLTSKTLESEEAYHGTGKPTLNFDDMNTASALPLQYPEFLESLKSRELDKKEVTCIPVSSGWYPGKEEEVKRLIKVQCYYSGGTGNFYMRPIEGITIVVDLDLKKVVRYIEHDTVPLPKAEGTDFRLSAQRSPMLKPLKTISLEQPDGPSFSVDGHYVRWANWEFHVKPDYRAGSIISQASVRDPVTGALRSVLYKGFASELFVPYMDPTEGWYFKTYMDASEYGFGLQCIPLQPLNDCPRNAHYMDGVFVDADGKPYIRPNMLCIFESYAGDVAWRHTEIPISDQEMWVTPYNRSEEYAGGLYVYQSHCEETVSRWTRRDRPIHDHDIVLWYTVGFHHIPCQEDFPVMPTVTESFELKPTSFFESNPIVKTYPNYERDLPQCTFSA